MRIVSYNLNGLRASLNKGLADWMRNDPADVYCFQEIKIDSQALQQLGDWLPGYEAHYFSAEKKGYSGTAILSRVPLLDYQAGMDHASYDAEGRVQIARLADCTLVNTYFPSGTTGDIRQAVKDEFLIRWRDYIQQLALAGEPLILCGDFNIAHTPKDIHDPVRNKDSSGFLPHERQWMTDFLALGYVDGLRVLTDAPDLYTWWSYRANARTNNKGWRIDYFLLSESLAPSLKAHPIHTDVHTSDHCPLEIVLG